MLQLEQRFYSRKEIAEVLGVNINDSNHFARNVKDKLTKWGYGFVPLPREGITITSIPTTPEERLKEIALRQFSIDVQTDAYAFACFLAAINDLEGFDSMPWEARAVVLQSEYDVQVSDRTLRSWCSKLMKKNAVAKEGGSSYWKTFYRDGIKIQTVVSKAESDRYYARRSELVAELFKENIESGMKQEPALKAAWKSAYELLWGEFHCCYYCCKGFLVPAFSDDEIMREIVELTQNIARKEIKA